MSDEKEKEKCLICGSVRHRSELIRLQNGKLVHKYHSGVQNECCIENEEVQSLKESIYGQ